MLLWHYQITSVYSVLCDTKLWAARKQGCFELFVVYYTLCISKVHIRSNQTFKLVIRSDFYIIDIYFDKYHHQNYFEMQYCLSTITMPTLSVGNRVWSKTTQRWVTSLAIYHVISVGVAFFWQFHIINKHINKTRAQAWPNFSSRLGPAYHVAWSKEMSSDSFWLRIRVLLAECLHLPWSEQD